MLRRSAATALLALVSLGGGPPAARADKDSAMQPADAVLGLVPKLLQERPFKPDAVARLTGASLQKDAATSTPFFQVYQSPQLLSGPLTHVEVRTPAEGKPGKDGLVILKISDRTCIRQKEVVARFGQNAEPVPPSPHGPPDALTYLVYRQDWGKLSFGFAPGKKGDGCLGAIVLDAIAARP